MNSNKKINYKVFNLVKHYNFDMKLFDFLK
jgi:hypothetical protein